MSDGSDISPGERMRLDYEAELEAERLFKKKAQMPDMLEEELRGISSRLAEIEASSGDSTEVLRRIADEIRDFRLSEIHREPQVPAMLMPVLYVIAAMLAYALFFK